MLQNLALDRKMKSKSLDIKPYLYLRKLERKKQVIIIPSIPSPKFISSLYVCEVPFVRTLMQCITKSPQATKGRRRRRKKSTIKIITMNLIFTPAAP
jgi:hypothetical protein